MPASTTPAPETIAGDAAAAGSAATPAAAEAIGGEITASDADTQEAPATTDEAQAVIAALVLAQRASAPARLTIADADMDVAVEPMGWESVRAGGATSQRWLLPEDAAGWHVNSAQAGEAGNVIISGRQLGVDAVFAPLAQGAVRVGQTIVVSDDAGGSYAYTVREISEPLPIVGANADTNALVAAYVAASNDAILTLITGWPDFTTTHRLFVVATLDE